MKAIVFHNRELFIVKDFESITNEVVAFFWKDGSWGNKSFPLSNGVLVSWTVNYAVKKNMTIRYKEQTIHNKYYSSIEGIAELMNIYNSKNVEQLDEELETTQRNILSELSEEVSVLSENKKQLTIDVRELEQQKKMLNELPDKKVSFLRRFMDKLKK